MMCLGGIHEHVVHLLDEHGKNGLRQGWGEFFVLKPGLKHFGKPLNAPRPERAAVDGRDVVLFEQPEVLLYAVFHHAVEVASAIS